MTSVLSHEWLDRTTNWLGASKLGLGSVDKVTVVSEELFNRRQF